ncbi:hypothetical protein Arub01_40630 [Actinomadura rubrobrunea]|uniref:Ribosomal protein mS38 C-terminal domain-containing protein n=1 Tax=Actinomadura rubrobrunea TaxID=115335 RepID=A0A9W6PWN3_9ACTN|nr:hypothetical protein Arub01_40630 [Actinomadura rubrobrunea]
MRAPQRYSWSADRAPPPRVHGTVHGAWGRWTARPFFPVTRFSERGPVGSVIKKRRKRMAKKKHRKLLKKTRIQRRNKK